MMVMIPMMLNYDNDNGNDVDGDNNGVDCHCMILASTTKHVLLLHCGDQPLSIESTPIMICFIHFYVFIHIFIC